MWYSVWSRVLICEHECKAVNNGSKIFIQIRIQILIEKVSDHNKNSWRLFNASNFKNFARLHFARGLRKVVSFASAFQVAAFFFSRFFSWCPLLIFSNAFRNSLKHKRRKWLENNFISQSWGNIKVDQVCARDGERICAAQREEKYLFWPVCYANLKIISECSSTC